MHLLLIFIKFAFGDEVCTLTLLYLLLKKKIKKYWWDSDLFLFVSDYCCIIFIKCWILFRVKEYFVSVDTSSIYWVLSEFTKKKSLLQIMRFKKNKLDHSNIIVFSLAGWKVYFVCDSKQTLYFWKVLILKILLAFRTIL